jgi:hypothetical protein
MDDLDIEHGYLVHVHVYSKVGEFEGSATGLFSSSKEAAEERDNIQELLRSCDSFTIVSNREDAEITLSRGVIENSVFKWQIVSL